MKLDFGLNLRQEQKLVMTQELQLSVKLLQLTTYELFEFVEEQLMENPMLEYDEKEDKFEGNKDDISKEKDTELDKIDLYMDNPDSDYDNYYNGEETISPLNFVSKEMNLWDFLIEQLNFMPATIKQNRIGAFIIDNIDENGYMKLGLDDITGSLGCKYEEAESVLQMIQCFEPPGVGARNLQECLKLQLKAMNKCDPILESIIDTMLVEVGENKISKIAKAVNIKESEAVEYINLIKGLNPRPGLAFYTDTVKYIIPDVYIEKVGEEFIVSVNEDGIPQLKINKTYRDLLKNKNSNEYKYVRDKLQSAVWMIKSIEQRISTIKRVVEEIVEYQREFFEVDGELKPMTLKQISSKIEMHESTVSRAVNGKYAQTPKGLFELKNFFMRGVQNNHGEDISTAKIKNSIKNIISSEKSNKPYSDAQLSEMLEKLDMNISRRTVAKYREELGIPSSSKRKK